MDNRYGPQNGAQRQQSQQRPQAQAPGIPSWLESLRAGERPVNNSSNFDAADLIEEGTLPSWMKPERGEMPGGPASAQRDAIRSASFSAPNTDDSGRNINAHSLIDEQSLPSWMQEAAGTRGGGESPGPANITASSLVQSDAIPEWMKNIAPASASPRPIQQDQPPRQRKPDDATAPSGPMKPLARGFSAGELLDQQSLPSWMAQSHGQPGTPGAPTPANEQGGQRGQAGFSASSLLDASALPSWLQESGQGKKVTPALPSQAFPNPGSIQPQQPQQTWQQGPATTGGPPANTPAGGGLSASSFLDRDSLPGWLTGTGDQPQAEPRQATSGLARQNVFGEQPRVENVRVPSRPRGEIHASQDSEVAANVFASMLGVASAPNYPTQQPNIQTPSGQQGAQGQPFPAQMPSPAQMQQPQGVPVGNPFAMPQNAPRPQGSSTTLGVPQGMPQNAPYGFSQPQTQNAPLYGMPQSQTMNTSLGVPQGMPQNAPYGAPQSQGASLGIPQGIPQNAPYDIGQGFQQGMGQPSQPMPGYPQGGQGNIYPPQGNIPSNYYTMGSQPTGMPSGMLNAPSLQQMPNGELRPEAKPAKRGLFNAIREWLSPSR